MSERLAGLAPAKVNLVLEVTGRRDDGYHEIDTILQTLELADEITIDLAGEPGIELTGRFRDSVPADASNLAWRAAEELAARCQQSTGGLRIAIEKAIPAAGGLGGGASDAATVLRLLQQVWGAPEDAVRTAAMAVGSDEAFFLAGGTCRARGRGEVVEPLADLAMHGVVLFVPHRTLERKTARLFAALGQLPFDTGAHVAAFLHKAPEHMSTGHVFNSFERVAFDLFEGLAGLRASTERATGETVHLAGAGPVLFWIGSVDGAHEVAARATGQDCRVIITRTTGSLWTR